jgi:hypothetical protein
MADCEHHLGLLSRVLHLQNTAEALCRALLHTCLVWAGC